MASRGAVPVLIGVFLGLLGVAWVISNPPGYGPDERAHYVKALGAGGGQLYGEPATVNKAQLRAFFELVKGENGQAAFDELSRKAQGAQSTWQRRTSRVFRLPAGLEFSAFGCGRLGDEGWGTCLSGGHASSKPTRTGTYVGTYQPFLYVLPGLAMRTSHEPLRAMRLGRLVNAAICLGLLLVATLLLWDGARGALSLIGLLVAFTPQVLFFSTVLNPTGPEITAAICFVASLIRVARRRETPAWVWAACAVSGAVLALSRSLGPFFVVALLLTVGALVGRREALAAVRAAPRASLLAGAAVAVAAAAGLTWELRYQPHVASGPTAIVKGLGPSLDAVTDIPRQAVGAFGALDTRLPLAAYIGWWLMFAVLIGAAAIVGGCRGRWSLLGLAFAVIALTLVVSAVYRQTGFGLQTRYILPYAVVLPLWAAELLNAHRLRLGARTRAGLLIAFASGAGVLHGVAWYTNARKVAVGPNAGWRFVSDADWVPPAGWWIWIGAAVAAAIAYALAGVAAAHAASTAPGASPRP
jgi:hypothetical protein